VQKPDTEDTRPSTPAVWVLSPRPCTLDLSRMRSPQFRMILVAAMSWLLLFVPSAGGQNTVLITLDQAVDLALVYSHALKADRTLVLQNQAQEITANLRPNPTLNFDSQFLPIFSPSNFSNNNLSEVQQFDIGVGYLFERGKKRQHRLQAAKDATAVTTAQVSDDERMLIFNVARNLSRFCWLNRRCNLPCSISRAFRTRLISPRSSTRPAI